MKRRYTLPKVEIALFSPNEDAICASIVEDAIDFDYSIIGD